MPKYKKYFDEMISVHKKLFDDFKELHEKYALDPKKWQNEFNEKGQEVLRIIRRYEGMLCGHQESGKFGVFSSKLSDKYWEAIRAHFPKIDSIGKL